MNFTKFSDPIYIIPSPTEYGKRQITATEPKIGNICLSAKWFHTSYSGWWRIRLTSCKHSQLPCHASWWCFLVNVSLIKSTSLFWFYDRKIQKAANQQATTLLPHRSIWTSGVVMHVKYCKSFTPKTFFYISLFLLRCSKIVLSGVGHSLCNCLLWATRAAGLLSRVSKNTRFVCRAKPSCDSKEPLVSVLYVYVDNTRCNRLGLS